MDNSDLAEAVATPSAAISASRDSMVPSYVRTFQRNLVSQAKSISASLIRSLRRLCITVSYFPSQTRQTIARNFEPYDVMALGICKPAQDHNASAVEPGSPSDFDHILIADDHAVFSFDRKILLDVNSYLGEGSQGLRGVCFTMDGDLIGVDVSQSHLYSKEIGALRVVQRNDANDIYHLTQDARTGIIVRIFHS